MRYWLEWLADYRDMHVDEPQVRSVLYHCILIPLGVCSLVVPNVITITYVPKTLNLKQPFHLAFEELVLTKFKANSVQDVGVGTSH